jgi:hypothetical protein
MYSRVNVAFNGATYPTPVALGDSNWLRRHVESRDALDVVREALESAAVPLHEVPMAYRGAARGCRAYSQFEGSLLLLAEEPDSRRFEVIGREES